MSNENHPNDPVLVSAVVNPLSLAVLPPPGEWGNAGADIVCGDGQPFGIPMASGGPSFGFLCTRMKHVRQMPGRIIGRTVDTDGKIGYAVVDVDGNADEAAAAIAALPSALSTRVINGPAAPIFTGDRKDLQNVTAGLRWPVGRRIAWAFCL